MAIIAKYKFDKTIYADLLPEFNAEFTSDKYNTTDEEVDGIITRTIESDSLPTVMRFGRVWVDGESTTDNRTYSLLEVLDMNTSRLTNCHSMFRYCKNLISINCEWDTSKVTDMQSMFGNCNNLTTLDVSNFNTSNVTNMGYMFDNCTNLTSLNVSNWNTSKVTNMGYMFNNCTNLTSLNVSNWNTSKVTLISHMFDHCVNLTSLDVSNFDTSNVINMYGMFNYCQSLISLDISNFNISDDTTNIDCIFAGTPLLTDIGMLYCNQSTINKIASVLPTNITQTIWVEDVDIKDLTSVEGVEFKQYAKNTEIMLTSPLLEGDKLVVVNGKLCHYHKMGKVVLDGSEDEKWYFVENFTNCARFKILEQSATCDSQAYIISDKFTRGYAQIDTENIRLMRMDTDKGGIQIIIDMSRLSSVNSKGLKQWLQQNPTTVVYELASPYYEIISEDPLDISIISETVDITNSSNIPLNMAISNNGMSTVAMSPSTTYTVAFDKEGEEDLTINLCGNEITTSNNVVEITTSSELGNDELIFYGDGVEVSNVRLLEGSVSGDSIPRESFKGLKNSFEDGYIPENVITKLGIIPDISQGTGITILGDNYTFPSENLAVMFSHSNFSKPHTFVVIPSNDSKTQQYTVHSMKNGNVQVHQYVSGFSTLLFNQPADRYRMYTEEPVNSTFRILILEGDWTHLTEEDWNHLGKYKVEYKVTGKNLFNIEGNVNQYYPNMYVVNNIANQVNGNALTANLFSSGYHGKGQIIKVKPNTDYSISFNLSQNSGMVTIHTTTKVNYYLGYVGTGNHKFTFNTGNNNEICLAFVTEGNVQAPKAVFSNIQLEEGSTATPYEPYKEYTKTFYLNSPLLEGDTIEDINGKATHVKRYEKVVLDGSENWEWYQGDGIPFVSLSITTIKDSSIPLCDKLRVRLDTDDDKIKGTNENLGIMVTSQYNTLRLRLSSNDTVESVKTWLSENPTTVVYELASPIYETISTESILCDSYTNGHLDFDSTVPIEKVRFARTEINLKYLQPNTNYNIYFNSDNVGIATIGLNTTWVNLDNVIKGINKIKISTTSEIIESKLKFNGIGFNASNIQVVATDKDIDFGYFKGLQSSFEDGLVTDENDENYGKYKVECKIVGKNKFDKSNVVLGYWDTDSTTYHTNIPSVFSHKTPIKVKPNTWYTIQFLGINSNVYVVGLHPFECICVVNNSSVSFYTNNRTEVYIQINVENTDLSKILDIIQLEEGAEVTSYEPYQGYTKTIYLNSPLLKGDTIEVHNNGKLCHYHKMGMVVLDGSEDFRVIDDNFDNVKCFGFVIEGKSNSARGVTKSDKFPYSIQWGDLELIQDATTDSVWKCNTFIAINKSKISTLDTDGFKQWLSENPTTVVYELAEPYYEEISPIQEDLIITSVKEGDLHIDTIVPISSKVTYNVNVQLLTDFEQSIVEQVQATQTTDLQSILDEEIDN